MEMRDGLMTWRNEDDVVALDTINQSANKETQNRQQATQEGERGSQGTVDRQRAPGKGSMEQGDRKEKWRQKAAMALYGNLVSDSKNTRYIIPPHLQQYW
jgi:hypothetical protein